MMAHPGAQEQVEEVERKVNQNEIQQAPLINQAHYVHPALVPKQPLQRRATAPSNRNQNKMVTPPGPSQALLANGKSKLERPATVHQRYKRKIGNYTLTKTLGAGSMGKVKLGIHDVTGHKVAVKIITRKIKKNSNATEKDEDAALTDIAHEDKRVMREVSLLFLLHHPFIVKMVDFMVTPHHYYLMFENVEGGQLLDYIISHGKLNERTARKFARQIISSLDYCHRNSVVHRDLKIENILISNSGSIKIIDFGLSNLYSSKSLLSTFCGSLYFAAPELLSAKPYTGPEVDIWSFGIVLYVLMCGEVPFDDKSMTMIHHKIKRGVVKYPAWLSPDCRHLLSRILVTNPSERATMVEIMQHPWINKGFHGPPDSYFPNRVTPELPVDQEVIKQMTGFQFGPPEAIQKQVEKSISEYLKESTSPAFSPRLTPCNKSIKAPISYPYLSIYCLAKEKLEREKNEDTNIVIKEEDRIDEETSEKANSHVTLRADSGLSRSKSCKPTMNGVSGRYNAIPTRPSQLKESTHLHPNKIPETVNLSRGNSISRSNSQRRGSGGNLNVPNSLEMVKENTSRKPSIRFNKTNSNNNDEDKQANKLSSNKNNQNKRLSEPFEKQNDQINLPEPNKVPQRKPSRLEKISNFLNRGSSLRDTKTPKSTIVEEVLSPSLPNTSSQIINHIQPVYLKGLFSVASTSTKKPKKIREEILRVLGLLKLSYYEGDGYISVQKSSNDSKPNNNMVSFTSNSEISSNASASGSKQEFSLPPPTINEVLENTSTSINNTNTNSINIKEKESNADVRFEIQIVKLSLLRLYGIRFRRLAGPSWDYKAICSQLLDKLKI